jgi:hypothetical protein
VNTDPKDHQERNVGRSFAGLQKAAAALLYIASLSDPPLRLLLGSDSYNAAEQSALQKLELDRKWKDLSVSTDYSADGLSPSCANPPL